MSVQKFDVIITGASFAGLAVASQLEGERALILDHKEIGEHQTSACGTPLYTVEGLGLRESVLQIHHEIYLHTTDSKTFKYKLAYPFCTIDYKKFCQGFLAKAKKLEIKRANILSFEGETIKTDQGDFSAHFLIDASGWSAVLGKHLDSKLVAKNNLSFGLETEIEYKEEGLHFWYEPKLLKNGYLWLFPAGNKSRFGLVTYDGNTQLRDILEKFLSRFNLKVGGLHGSFLATGLRNSVVDNVFLVGDAAGQCLPLTCEGIRPSIFFGIKLGQIIQSALEKEITFSEAQKLYRDFVLARRKFYNYIFWAQKAFKFTPGWIIKVMASLMQEEKMLAPLFHRYFELARLS